MTHPLEMVIAFDADGNPVTSTGRKIGPGGLWPHQQREQEKNHGGD